MVLVVKNNHSALNECERKFSKALAFHSSSLKNVKRWVIAHSGGLDSQVLLYLASRMLPLPRVLVVHVHHHLQAEADEWAEFSKSQAELNSLPFARLDVFPENSSENAARTARYDAFAHLLEEGDCLLMGHHADDQAETILFRMLRGAGLVGLSGIVPYRVFESGHLLRPLLGCTRELLEKLALDVGLDHINDPSNTDLRYDRNYLRHSVIPLLKQRWPSLVERWQQNAVYIAESNRLLEEYMEGDLEVCLESNGSLNIAQLVRFSERRREALLRYWLFKASGLRINSQQLEVITKSVISAKHDADPCYDLGDQQLRRFQQCLYIVPKFKGGEVVSFPVKPGDLDLGDGVLSVEHAESGLSSFQGVEVRRRQGGERCRPHGKKHSVAVKKLLQEAAIPSWQKVDWPLLFHGDELVAVPGICFCEGWYSEKSGFSVLWCPFSLSDSS